MNAVLSPQETTLLSYFRKLPPDAAEQLASLVERLGALASGKIDWSDEWSDEDLRDFRAASLRRLDESEAEVD